MAVRCESCSKFASLEPGEPELDGDIDIRDEVVSASVRLPRKCADCDDELQEYTFELETSSDMLMTECPGAPDEDKGGGISNQHEWEIPEDVTFETTERMDDKGGTIKHARYMKKMLGVESTFNVTCARCKAEVTLTLKDETNAGSFDNLN